MKLRTEQDILDLIQQDTWMMEVLQTAAKLNLPDWWIGAGFVRSKVWDTLHDFDTRTPLGDIDVIYLDKTNTDEQQEKLYEKKLNDLLPGVGWSVKNHARMHFLNNDPPYDSTSYGLSRWVETATCIGVKLEDDKLKLTAPHGIDDLVNLILRPSPRTIEQHNFDVFNERIQKKHWLQKWPKLQVEY